MTPDIAADIAIDALRLVMLIVMVLITPGLIVGVLVSLFQAATQINEQTMSFLPRLLVTLVAIGLSGYWVSDKLMQYTVNIFQRASQLVG
ncbi:flagellar biosynthetic protein FliQ [Dyella jejuensis]|uniref:Flagellar biosynthetic protein FliQ n=1 Tax=Dyella jejuensis TaxID=1432009 RepID=A0ABW8JJ51_9GAMM